jgi:putative ABC transport system permease protein
MGYTQRWLLGVVFEQALILAALGFLPGLALSLGLYALIGAATELTVALPPARAAAVLGLTLAMCAASGALATRRLAAADPADVF